MNLDEEQRITEEVRKNPVQMTSRQQSILAAVCEVLSNFVRDEDWDVKHNDRKVADRLRSVIYDFDATAVEFGQLYDKLHRTGANA